MARRNFLLRGILVVVFALIIWVISVSYKQVIRNQRIEKEIATLQAEADKIRKENETFSEKIGYFSSSDFQEQEAKQKLGMKKNAETVVAIKPQGALPDPLQNNATPAQKTGERHDTLPNYKKWWQLFFQP